MWDSHKACLRLPHIILLLIRKPFFWWSLLCGCLELRDLSEFDQDVVTATSCVLIQYHTCSNRVLLVYRFFFPWCENAHEEEERDNVATTTAAEKTFGEVPGRL